MEMRSKQAEAVDVGGNVSVTQVDELVHFLGGSCHVLADSPRQPETIIGGRPSTQLLLTEGQPIFSSHKKCRHLPRL